MAHALVDGIHITDRGYQSDRVYDILTTTEALTNADSFGLLVRELGSGRPVISMAPVDTLEDCPSDWQPIIRVAIARAQRWNRNASVSTHDNRTGWLSRWTDLQTQYLGSTTPETLNAAAKVYDRVEKSLRSPIEFECKTDAERAQ
ncbi:MAG: hypothetical protein M3O68_07205 [Thermoproteota archaeon]|nr:hypothetical protein [Thermoproteota archaeon]